MNQIRHISESAMMKTCLLSHSVIYLCVIGMLVWCPEAYSQAAEEGRAVDGRWFQAIHVGQDGRDRVATMDLTNGKFSLVRFVRDPQRLREAVKNESVAHHLDEEHLGGGWVVDTTMDGDLKADPRMAVDYDETCDVLTVTEADRTYQMHRAAYASFEVVNEADANLPPVKPVGEDQRGRWTTSIVMPRENQPVALSIIYELTITDDDTFTMTGYSVLLSEEFVLLGLVRAFRYDGRVFSEDGELQQNMDGARAPARSSIRYNRACDQLILVAPVGDGKMGITRFARPRKAEAEGTSG